MNNHILIDFYSGSLGYRTGQGRAQHQMITKAIGIKKDYLPTVLDATAGLGRDAFILATLGCQVTLLERSTILYESLNDALQRAQEHPATKNMTLIQADAIEWMQQCKKTFDVVYLDPMFPEKNKSALVKKDLQQLQQLIGKDEDADALLAPSLLLARKRIVVKRHKTAPWLANQKPDFCFNGKSTRFDVYRPTVLQKT
ncbi:MAG: class I SAM-dependent methyltransferase [Gammaproteobacteria bacterium]